MIYLSTVLAPPVVDGWRVQRLCTPGLAAAQRSWRKPFGAGAGLLDTSMAVWTHPRRRSCRKRSCHRRSL